MLFTIGQSQSKSNDKHWFFFFKKKKVRKSLRSSSHSSFYRCFSFHFQGHQMTLRCKRWVISFVILPAFSLPLNFLAYIICRNARFITFSVFSATIISPAAFNSNFKWLSAHHKSFPMTSILTHIGLLTSSSRSVFKKRSLELESHL